jgi:hypothetical protein
MDVVVQLLILVWIVLFVLILQWSHMTSRSASVATWLGLTIISWWLEIAVAFFAVHAVLFSLGREVAILVAVLTIAVMTLTPAGWAYGLSHRNRHHTVSP